MKVSEPVGHMVRTPKYALSAQLQVNESHQTHVSV